MLDFYYLFCLSCFFYAVPCTLVYICVKFVEDPVAHTAHSRSFLSDTDN